MPEQLTKHPDVTLSVLRSAGAQCGSGLKPEILTTCPAPQFCRLPGGEICVYGLADAGKMTQLTKADWRALQFQYGGNVAAFHTVPLGTLLLAVLAAFILGMLFSGWLRGVRQRRLARRKGPP